jgi:hypothetical protein
MTAEHPDLMTTGQAGKALGVSRTRVYQLIQVGKLDATQGDDRMWNWVTRASVEKRNANKKDR